MEKLSWMSGSFVLLIEWVIGRWPICAPQLHSMNFFNSSHFVVFAFFLFLCCNARKRRAQPLLFFFSLVKFIFLLINWWRVELIRWSWMSVMGHEHITLYPVIKEKIYLFFKEGAAHNSSTHQSTQPKKIKQFNFLFGFINWFIYELIGWNQKVL